MGPLRELNRIGVISDTHGDVEAWERALEIWGPVDLIVHAGDVLYHGPRNPLVQAYRPPELAELINASQIPVLIARGNCDADVDQLVLDWPLQSQMVLLQTPYVRLVATHGQGMDKVEMVELAKRYRADIFVFGHTHVPVLEKVEGIILLNPGSPALPKGQEGPTVAVIDEKTVYLKDLKEGRTLGQIKLS